MSAYVYLRTNGEERASSAEVIPNATQLPLPPRLKSWFSKVQNENIHSHICNLYVDMLDAEGGNAVKRDGK